MQQAIAQPAFQFPSFGRPEPQIIVVGEQQEEEGQDEDEPIMPRSKAVVKQTPSKVVQPSRVIKRELTLTQSSSMASTSAPLTSHQDQMPSTSAAASSSNSNQDGICM